MDGGDMGEPAGNENDNGGMSFGLGGYGEDGMGLPGTLGQDHNDDISYSNDPEDGSGNSGNQGMPGSSSSETLSEDNPLGKYGKGFLGFLADTAFGKAVNSIFGQAAPISQGVLGMGKAAMNNDPNQAFNGMFNTMANTATMGMHGIANGVSNALGFGPISGEPNNASAPATASGAGGNMDYSHLAGVLASLYQGNRQASDASGALNQLNGLFAPDSPYAQMMRQQMERKDAAGGRRSQYGPRETQLAALLAQHQANALTSPGYGGLMSQQQAGRNAGMNNLLALMGKTGPLNGPVNTLGNGISGMMRGGGLQSLMNGGYSNNWNLGANAGPQMPSFGGSDPGGDGGYGDWFGG